MSFRPIRTIVVGGIYRSGSTWLFNAVRLIHELAGHDVWSGGRVAYWNGQPITDSAVAVVKVHPYDEMLENQATHILTSWRDLEAVRDSWKRWRGEHLPEKRLQAMKHDHDRWAANACFKMRYETLTQHEGPRRILDMIRGHFELTAKVKLEDLIEELQDAMKPPENRRKDPTTLVFSDHYTSQSYEDTLRHYHV